MPGRIRNHPAAVRPPNPQRAERPPPPPPPARPTGHPSASTYEANPVDQRQLQRSLAGCGADPALQRRVLDRVNRMPAADQPRERELLDRVARGPNGDRAVRAYEEVGQVADTSPRARARLTPEIREALVRGVAEPRNPNDSLGAEGVLGARQARTAARTLADMPQDRYDEVNGLLNQAGGPNPAARGADPQAERALILSAVAARAPRINQTGQSAVVGDNAMAEVRDFARDVRGQPREELMRTTTARDIDSRQNMSGADPAHLNRPSVGGRSDNDGLVQRFTTSCAPTAAEIAAADRDPVYARRLNQEQLASGDTTGSIAAEQRAMLERNNGVAVSRAAVDEARDARGRVTTALDSANATADERRRIDEYLAGGVSDPAAVARAQRDLAAVRGRAAGQPSEADVRSIRDVNAGPRAADMALDPALAGLTRTPYVHNEVPETGMTQAQTDDLARRLRYGDDVGLRLSNSGDTSAHAVMVTDVRGQGADRRFLVSDPWSGRTAWISEADMRAPNSQAFDREFGVRMNRVSHTYTPPAPPP